MVIGVTGGVGSGKSTILEYLEECYGARLILADDVARELQEPGRECYGLIVKEFGEGILKKGSAGIFAGNPALRPIDRAALAEIVFNDPEKLKLLNSMTHPQVRQEIEQRIATFYMMDNNALIVIEAALLIEAGYLEILDEMWAVTARKEIRIERLMASRGYSQEKCEDIMASQKTDEEYRRAVDFVIDNSGSTLETHAQIDERLSRI